MITLILVATGVTIAMLVLVWCLCHYTRFRNAFFMVGKRGHS